MKKKPKRPKISSNFHMLKTLCGSYVKYKNFGLTTKKIIQTNICQNQFFIIKHI